MQNRVTPHVDWAQSLRGPILVLGAGGFVGANLFRRLLASRQDVFGVARTLPVWRLEGIDESKLLEVELTNEGEIRSMIEYVRPATVFDCVSYGAYSFETDSSQIYDTNFLSLVRLLELLRGDRLAAFVHAGSSSEYGLNCTAPAESAERLPNSDYAVSKNAANEYLTYAGKVLRMPVVNLRLYSVYGPYEDVSRLIPAVVRQGLSRQYPPLVSPETSRDFVHVDDVCEAFLMAAARMTPDLYGEAFNVGSGRRTTIRDVAETARRVFGIEHEASFGEMPGRAWDLADWYADPSKAERLLGWRARTSFADGLQRTADWFRSQAIDPEKMTKRSRADKRRSVTAIIACYKDGQAIPIMYERLVATFRKLDIDYEIIFVNDASPDDSAEQILKLSAIDKSVLGITHSRNFGSQMAFRSGMELATKDGLVLLDGDLQDPPELIEQFYQKWAEGYDVVYGVRIKREMPRLWSYMYKGFYRVFSAFSYIPIPRDAGDFSLIDKRVVSWLLLCPERDLFLRGLRAYVGFKQTGVDYVRPERMFGRSTNNLLKNLAWAKRGIFSFSDVPISMLTAGGIALLGACAMLALISVLVRIYAPQLVAPGVTTILLVVLFFGSINLFAVGLVGEYIAKIMHEVKGRPRFIRSSLIRFGGITQLLPKSEVGSRDRQP